MKTLTADQALASAFHRHALSEPAASIEGVAEALVGLHNTSPVSPYLSLRARILGFARPDLDALMWETWTLARFRSMRLTMFVFPHDLLEIAAAATRKLTTGLAERWLRDSQFSAEEFERLATRVVEALAAGPLTTRGLRRALDVPTPVDLPGVVSRLCDLGRVVGGAPPRSWRSSIREYHLWEDALPTVDLYRWDEVAATNELVLRYIRTYGPVTIDDMSWWTGFTKGCCRAVVQTEADRLEEVAVEGWPGPMFRTTGDDDQPRLGSRVAVLPLLDPYVQGYRDRIRFLGPGREDYVYDGGGNATATLVQRGRIIGVWQPCNMPEASIRYHLFAKPSAATRSAAESELAAAGSLYFDRAVDVVAVDAMEPLSAGGGRSAAHPLDGVRHRASRRTR